MSQPGAWQDCHATHRSPGCTGNGVLRCAFGVFGVHADTLRDFDRPLRLANPPSGRRARAVRFAVDRSRPAHGAGAPCEKRLPHGVHRQMASGLEVAACGQECLLTARLPEGPTTRGFHYYFGTDVPNYPPFGFLENEHLVAQPTAGARLTPNCSLVIPAPWCPAGNSTRSFRNLPRKRLSALANMPRTSSPSSGSRVRICQKISVTTFSAGLA